VIFGAACAAIGGPFLPARETDRLAAQSVVTAQPSHFWLETKAFARSLGTRGAIGTAVFDESN
jgi:hypothetical protein